MNEKIPVVVTVQMERLAEQLVRGRPLGPWKLEAVGRSDTEVQKKLATRFQKILPRALPTDYFEGALPDVHEHWQTHVQLEPQDHDGRWTEPVDIALDSFRWQLRSGQCVVRIPAINCGLFGNPDELDEAEVARQARIGLLREAENLDLMQIRQKFASRTFTFCSLQIEVPIGGEQEKRAGKRAELKKTATLRATSSDLTIAKLAPVWGLDRAASNLAQHFLGEAPQSVLLVGPAGVGKTALVHRMISLRESLSLGDRKVWSTSGARIVSGMSGLGMWQERCSKLLRQAHATKAILHLGSLFELMEAGKIDGQPGVASMVRNSVSRGQLQAIAECTPEQLAMVERDDPMLLRAFTRIEIKELPGDKIIEILTQASNSIHTDSSFSPQAIEELYRLHTRFATYSALPAAALRLMSTMQDGKPDTRVFEADDVARAFANQTGLPRFLVDDSVKLDLDAIRSSLSKNVIGQAEPVNLMVDLIATLKARLVRPGRPLASLMFIGPTGVGKTEMAKAIARLLYSDSRRMIRIDMSEYSTPWSAAKLIGKPGEGDGTLTSPIREQPFSVVLLDEFEKADSNVFDLLLQLLGEGRLTDAQGRLADFRNAVVIMTSNLGAETFRDSNFGFSDGQAEGWREHFLREVRKFVRPEFLGRIDRIVPFQPLPMDIVRQIALRELALLQGRPGIKYSDASLEFKPAAIDRLCELGYEPKYGARPLRRTIEENVAVPLADALSVLSRDSRWRFHVDVVDDQLAIVPEKISSKTETLKDAEAEWINSWQKLGTMARTARNSMPVRNLDNELERSLRQNEVLRRKLEAAPSPRRAAALKEELLKGEASVETARRIRAQLLNVISDISQAQLQLMLRWYRNESIDWETCRQDGKLLMARLRQSTEDVLQGRIAEGNLITLMVTGNSRPALEALLDAYTRLAESNGWIFDQFLVRAYDPLLDSDSPEFRKRSSERREAKSQDSQPTLRLLSVSENAEGKKEKVCDLFRISDAANFANGLDSSLGFVLQIRGEGVVSWLENEYGTVHFFDSKAAGPKRRVRIRVSVFSGRLLSIELPSNWKEPVSAPDRDPRRVFNLAENAISDNQGRFNSYAQGKQAEALVRQIEQEHEQTLWSAIGYAGIPKDAQLREETDMPF